MIDNDNDDDDGALPPRLRALLEQGGAGPPVPPGVSDRLLGKVLLSVGAATAVAASSAAATTASTAAPTTAAPTTAATSMTAATSATATATAVTKALAVKFALGLAAVGVVGGGVVVATRPATSAPVSTSSAAQRGPQRDVVVDDLTHEPPLQHVREGDEKRPGVTAPPSDRAARPLLPLSTSSTSPTSEVMSVRGPGHPLQGRSGPGAGGEVGADVVTPAQVRPLTTMTAAVDEAALLERARVALANADAAAALAAVDEHARRAPHGQLVEEREALRVIALSRAGRSDDARAAGAAFLSRWPSSLLADRVRTVTR